MIEATRVHSLKRSFRLVQFDFIIFCLFSLKLVQFLLDFSQFRLIVICVDFCQFCQYCHGLSTSTTYSEFVHFANVSISTIYQI